MSDDGDLLDSILNESDDSDIVEEAQPEAGGTTLSCLGVVRGMHTTCCY